MRLRFEGNSDVTVLPLNLILYGGILAKMEKANVIIISALILTVQLFILGVMEVSESYTNGFNAIVQPLQTCTCCIQVGHMRASCIKINSVRNEFFDL